MEHQKISRLLNDSTISKFIARKCIGMNDQYDQAISI